MYMAIIGKYSKGRITTTVATKNGVVTHSRLIKPVEQLSPLDIPPFMVKCNPIKKSKVKQGKMTFAEILAEQERILGNT